MHETRTRNDVEVSSAHPAPASLMPDGLTTFPPNERVMGLVLRYRSVLLACRAAGHGGGGGPSPNLVGTVDLTFNRARRLMEMWRPDRCDRQTGRLRRDPIDHWLLLDKRAARRRGVAAAHQLHQVGHSWSTRQPHWDDTAVQTLARRLWNRADAAVDAVDKYEKGEEFQTFLAFVAMVMVLWSVHEEPETFWRYVYG